LPPGRNLRGGRSWGSFPLASGHWGILSKTGRISEKKARDDDESNT
jgi:hypothetical protein